MEPKEWWAERTPWAVRCIGVECGKQYLTEEEYNSQMRRPDDKWKCPNCGQTAWFDDDNYEEMCELREKEEI
jgi:NAD-dependent SIR2 family protein deacetylase